MEKKPLDTKKFINSQYDIDIEDYSTTFVEKSIKKERALYGEKTQGERQERQRSP